MSIECIKDARLEDTGFNYTMSLIQGKYKMFKRTRGRPPRSPGRVPADPAKSRIQPDRTWKIPDPDSGFHVRLG